MAAAEQPSRKGDKLGIQGGCSQKGNHEERQAWETRRSGSQEQPRREIMKGDKLGRQGGQEQPRQGGSDIMTIWRFQKSATQSLRSKNPYYSFPLSGEKTIDGPKAA